MSTTDDEPTGKARGQRPGRGRAECQDEAALTADKVSPRRSKAECQAGAEATSTADQVAAEAALTRKA